MADNAKDDVELCNVSTLLPPLTTSLASSPVFSHARALSVSPSHTTRRCPMHGTRYLRYTLRPIHAPGGIGSRAHLLAQEKGKTWWAEGAE